MSPVIGWGLVAASVVGFVRWFNAPPERLTGPTINVDGPFRSRKRP